MYTLREDFTHEAAISRTGRRLHNRLVNDETRERHRHTILILFSVFIHIYTRVSEPSKMPDVFRTNCKRCWSIHIPQTAPFEGEFPSVKTPNCCRWKRRARKRPISTWKRVQNPSNSFTKCFINYEYLFYFWRFVIGIFLYINLYTINFD